MAKASICRVPARDGTAMLISKPGHLLDHTGHWRQVGGGLLERLK